jgi:hypothetical protein
MLYDILLEEINHSWYEATCMVVREFLIRYLHFDSMVVGFMKLLMRSYAP